MSNLRKIANDRSMAPSTSINDLAPAYQELSLNALDQVVGGTEPIRGGAIVVKGGCGDGSVDHVNKTCDE